MAATPAVTSRNLCFLEQGSAARPSTGCSVLCGPKVARSTECSICFHPWKLAKLQKVWEGAGGRELALNAYLVTDPSVYGIKPFVKSRACGPEKSPLSLTVPQARCCGLVCAHFVL